MPELNTPFVPLVDVTRGDSDVQTVESVHYGAVAVVDGDGRLRYAAGDPDALIFTRSTLKPFQALPFLSARGHEQLGFERDEIALMCASHSGEDKHVEVVGRMLQKARCDEHHLGCGCHVPLYYASTHTTPPVREFGPVYNNCSGKHTGFLAACRLFDEPVEGYLEMRHGVQVRIRQAISELVGASAPLPYGIDGCSAPNYAMPLSQLATLYARVARGSADGQHGESFATIFDAMTSRPDLVSGEGRQDLAYMTTGAGDWVSKAGADGVQVLASKRADLAIAVKISDGSARALHVAFVEALIQCGIADGVDLAALEPFAHPVIKNHRKQTVGTLKANFSLQRRTR